MNKTLFISVIVAIFVFLSLLIQDLFFNLSIWGNAIFAGTTAFIGYYLGEFIWKIWNKIKANYK